MNALRFRPAFEALDRRDMPSATAPIVAFEYLVVAAAPASPAADDVVVDGKIITAENPASASSRDQHLEVLSFHWGATPADKNETIAIQAGRTETPLGAGEVLTGIDVRPR